MPGPHYDLIVIGAGSGGMRAARLAAGYGAKVAIVESSRVGGTCVIRGCVPKKLLVFGSQYAQHLEDMAGYGWHVPRADFDWGALVEAKNRETERLEGVYRSLLMASRINLIEGKGRLVDGTHVAVGDTVYSAGKILIATGGWPILPDVLGVEHAITSNEALDLSTLPSRMIIVGGGYIAMEFAGIFNSLGVDVTVVIRREKPLRGFDEDIREKLMTAMMRRGVRFLVRVHLTSITRKGNDTFDVVLSDGATMTTDKVMYATGRAPNTQGLGVEDAGLRLTEAGAIVVDEWNQTSVPGVFAIGDVTGRVALTPVAINEGVAFAETFFNGHPRVMDYGLIPYAVFSQPSVATVGLTEAAARAKGPVRIFRSTFRPMKNSLAGRDEMVLMKLVVDEKTDRVLGCHMVGLDAPEIIQALAIALKCGATKAQFDETIAVHPTTAEEFVLMRTPV